MLASRLEIAPSANSLTRGSAASDPLVVRAGDRRTLARRASSCPLYATRTKRRNERNDQGNGPPAVEVIGSESTSATRAVTRVTARARIDRLTRHVATSPSKANRPSRVHQPRILAEFWHRSETSRREVSEFWHGSETSRREVSEPGTTLKPLGERVQNFRFWRHSATLTFYPTRAQRHRLRQRDSDDYDYLQFSPAHHPPNGSGACCGGRGARPASITAIPSGAALVCALPRAIGSGF